MDWGQIFCQRASGRSSASTAIVYALAAIGLNIHFGYTGLLNFGQVGFLAVGAYGLAITVVYFDLPFWRRHPASVWPAPCCSPCCSASRRCGCAPTTWRS